MKLGLHEKGFKDLLKKYPPLTNCIQIDPPKLNAEFKSSLPKAVALRDRKVFARQEKITACSAANVKIISYLLTQESAIDCCKELLFGKEVVTILKNEDL